MLKRGNKPKPSVIRLITNASRKPVKATEPTPKREAVKPKWLAVTAADVWDDYAPQLIEIGLLTGVDVDLFIGFCRVAAKMRYQPSTMSAADYGNLRLLGAVFGMGPAERTRLSVEPDDKQAKTVALR